MTKTTLLEQLDDLKANFAKNVPADIRQVMANATATLQNSSLTETSSKKGDLATSFILSNQNGDPVELQKLLASGPVVLSFYRGAWCPFCNLELKALQNRLTDIEALGATLIAISPQSPDSSLSTFENNKLRFDVLSDPNNKVAKKFGLVFTLPKALRPIYKDFGIDIVKSNQEDSFELPFAATFIVDTSGVIQYSFVDVDYTTRAEPQAIIDALKALS